MTQQNQSMPEGKIVERNGEQFIVQIDKRRSIVGGVLAIISAILFFLGFLDYYQCIQGGLCEESNPSGSIGAAFLLFPLALIISIPAWAIWKSAKTEYKIVTPSENAAPQNSQDIQ